MNPGDFVFCGQCGASLVREQKEPKEPEGERRHLTVMFCDLVGSTALSEQLDPEDLHEVVRQYQQTCEQVIQRFEGYTARYVGDALLVYFGYPQAHEDDAARAIRTGLGIVAAIRDLNTRLQETIAVLRTLPLHVRIGIHTGLVVVGELRGRDYREAMALGDTPNIAARLQGIASPNSVVISAYTHRLTVGFFECRELGPQQLKGIALPISAYHAVQESRAQSRFEVATAAGLTPLVGRKEELGLLLERWEQVKEGQGWVILLSGEAGVGKSRLLKELKEQLTTEAPLWLELHCSPYYQNSALYPVIDLLQQLLRFHGEDFLQEKLSKLETVLQGFGFVLPETVPLFASLLSLPLPAHYAPLTLTPQRQKQKLQETLLALLLALTEQHPVLLVAEDLHWADPSTLELLSFFVDHGPIARSFILLTFRPELHLSWATRSYVTSLTLGRLSHKQVEEMVVGVTKGKTLPAEVMQQLVTKTDGIPLFVEELTKTVLELGMLREEAHRYTLTGPFLPVGIPATLHDSLLARLDRLGPVKEVAQLGATLGREFPYELLRAVSSLDESVLQTALHQLVEAEFLYRRKLHSHDLYLFKHALIQGAAYQSLLKSTRQQSHKQIAQVLQERFPEIVETQPELLAHHCTEAGLTEQAIPYWQQAGQRAIERSANVEAAHHLTKGLELLKTLPETPERAQHELSLQIALGVSLMAAKGYAAPQAKAAYTRARELCQQVGETPQLIPVLRGLAAFYFVRAELESARQLGEQCLRLARSVQDPDLLLEAYQEMGGTLFTLGEFIPALEHLEQGIALYDSQKHRSHTLLYGQDPGVSLLARASHTLWHLGYPDQALKKSQEAVTLAQKLAHPYSLAYASFFTASLHQLRHERQAAQEWADITITLSTDQGFPNWVALATIVRGWTLVGQEHVEEGIVQIRQGMAACRAMGTEIGWPYSLALLSYAHAKAGQVEEGLAFLTEALDIVQQTGQRTGEPGLYILKGWLLLARSPAHPAESEACFHQAITIARRQHAKLPELQAIISLCRLWRQQGKKKEARQLLTEIYSWFTEGFETRELKEARALLKTL